MLSWFEVENFKSIKKLHLDFSPFMVFVGPNGAGKTNIIQALELFLEILNTGSTEPIKPFYQYLRRRKKAASPEMHFTLCTPTTLLSTPEDSEVPSRRKTEEPSPALQVKVGIVLRARSDESDASIVRETIDLLFKDHPVALVHWSIRDGFKVGEGDTRVIEQLSSRLGIPFEKLIENVVRMRASRPEALKFAWFFKEFIFKDAIPSVTRLRLDTSALRGVPLLGVPRHSDTLGQMGDGLPEAVERMRRKRGKAGRAFESVLGGLQAVYPRIEKVTTIRNPQGNLALSFTEGEIEGELGVANVSDGVLHALALLVAIEGTPESSILAIEEPENAIHPWALQKIIEHAQERLPRAEPLLLTTHSSVVVDAIKDPASLYIVENTQKQGTKVTPALRKEAALRAILAEGGQKLGEVWLGGLLGGVSGADL